MFRWFFNLFRRSSVEERRAEDEAEAMQRALVKCRKAFPDIQFPDYRRPPDWKYQRAVGEYAGVPYFHHKGMSVGGIFWWPSKLTEIAEYLGRRHIGVMIHECCHYWLALVDMFGHLPELNGKVFGWANSCDLSGFMKIKHRVKCMIHLDIDNDTYEDVGCHVDRFRKQGD